MKRRSRLLKNPGRSRPPVTKQVVLFRLILAQIIPYRKNAVVLVPFLWSPGGGTNSPSASKVCDARIASGSYESRDLVAHERRAVVARLAARARVGASGSSEIPRLW